MSTRIAIATRAPRAGARHRARPRRRARVAIARRVVARATTTNDADDDDDASDDANDALKRVAATTRGKRRRAESTDAVATFMTRRFGLKGGLAWLGALTFGVLSEQLKTRRETREAIEDMGLQTSQCGVQRENALAVLTGEASYLTEHTVMPPSRPAGTSSSASSTPTSSRRPTGGASSFRPSSAGGRAQRGAGGVGGGGVHAPGAGPTQPSSKARSRASGGSAGRSAGRGRRVQTSAASRWQ